MPELPEVETIVTGIRSALKNVIIRDVILHQPAILRTHIPDLRASLAHRTITAIEREGKRILFRLKPTGLCVIHLGMSGRLTLERRDAPRLPHTHIQIRFDKTRLELRFRDPRRFGGFWFFDGRDSSTGTSLAPLGPDALSIRTADLRRICRRRRQIKALLLDQRFISGLGNIYCDEALFAAGIHPMIRANMLTDGQIRRLAGSIRNTLHRSIDSGGSTLRDYRKADGSEGAFQKICRVYGREKLPCRQCGTLIQRIQAAGRSSHLCPSCQPF